MAGLLPHPRGVDDQRLLGEGERGGGGAIKRVRENRARDGKREIVQFKQRGNRE